MMFSKFFFLSVLFTICVGDQFRFKNEDFKLVIEYNRHGLDFEGVKIDKDGLKLGKYFYRDGFLTKPFFKYSSVEIDLSDLDPIALYRLEMFLLHNKNLKDVDVSSFFEVDRCPHENVYYIRNNGSENLIKDTNYCQNDCYNLDIYLLDELENLVNNIIPEEYKEFCLPSYIYPCED